MESPKDCLVSPKNSRNYDSARSYWSVFSIKSPNLLSKGKRLLDKFLEITNPFSSEIPWPGCNQMPENPLGRKENPVINGHKSLRTLMKRSYLW